MKRTIFLLAALVAFAATARADEVDPAHVRDLLATRSSATVIVRAVVHVDFTENGQSEKHDGRAELAGVFIDPSGLVMVTNMPFTPPAKGSDQSESIKITPSDFKVVLPPDSTEHPATVVATDADLGVAFLQVSDLGGKPAPAVNFSDSGDIVVGGDILQVNRLDRGFDYAPYTSLGAVIGEVSKPRHAFIITGGSHESGLPVFDPSGKPVGLVISIDAADVADNTGPVFTNHEHGETMTNPRTGMFLIPSRDVAAVVAKALARAHAAASATPTAVTPAAASAPAAGAAGTAPAAAATK